MQYGGFSERRCVYRELSRTERARQREWLCEREFVHVVSTPGRTCTLDLSVRSRALYSTELQGLLVNESGGSMVVPHTSTS